RCLDGVHHRPLTASFESREVLVSGPRTGLSLGGPCLAILVYQGSSPKVPYQALVIRESARLFSGFTPWGQKAFSVRVLATARSTPLTLSMIPRRPPSAQTPSAKCLPGVGGRAGRPS